MTRAQRIVPPDTAFATLRPKRPRRHDGDHLTFIRGCSCAVCGGRKNVQAAHIRMGNRVYGKRETGAGEKPSDQFTTPLCAKHHDEQHRGSEQDFWKRNGIDPFHLATSLYAISGDHDAAELILRTAHDHSTWLRSPVPMNVTDHD
jgi:hypothetical protein